ncbi:MAG: hypothetical protein AAGF75_04770 [Cyanobacteria bacterium P01_H01_bin.130]
MTEAPPNPMAELVRRHTNTDPGDLLYHLAIGELSGILACKSGAGKTTSLHYSFNSSMPIPVAPLPLPTLKAPGGWG